MDGRNLVAAALAAIDALSRGLLLPAALATTEGRQGNIMARASSRHDGRTPRLVAFSAITDEQEHARQHH